MSDDEIEYDRHFARRRHSSMALLREDFEDEGEADVFLHGPLPESELDRIEYWSAFALMDNASQGSSVPSSVVFDGANLGTNFDFIPLWLREENATACVNLHAAFINLMQAWTFEQFVIVSIVGISTVTFYYAPGPPPGQFNAKLDFHYLFTSFMYLFTFLSRVTFGRRETAAVHISKIKSLVCQIELGLLLWNRKRARPDQEFEDRTCSILVELVKCFFRLLELPTQLDGELSKQHRRVLRKRTQQIRTELTKRIFQVHYCFEECKANESLLPGETNRLADFVKNMQVEMERVHLLKTYRTSQTARSFVNMFMLICPAFWSLYFGNTAETTDFAFALVLSFVSVMIAQTLAKMMRITEDPFISSYQGENISIRDELMDTVERLKMVRRYCKKKRRRNLTINSAASLAAAMAAQKRA